MATKPQPALPHQPQAPKVPSRYKFPANDPIYKQAKRLFRLNPWIRGLMTLQDLSEYLYEQQQNRAGQVATVFNPTAAGFTLASSCATPSGGPSGLTWGYSNAQTTGCLTGNLSIQSLTTQIPSTQNSYNLMWQNPNVPSQRQVLQRYTRTGSYPTQSLTKTLPVTRTSVNPQHALDLVPELAPFQAPQIAPRSMPVPYRHLPNIDSPFKETGYETQPQTKPNRRFDRNNDIDIVIKSGSRGNPSISTRPSNHSSSRPPIGVRERKIKSSTLTKAGIAFGAVTETADFIGSLWEALPWKYRTYGYSGKPQDKIRDIYNNLGKVDVAKAIKNVANNQIEDYIYGIGGNASRKLNQEMFSHQGMGINRGANMRGLKYKAPK